MKVRRPIQKVFSSTDYKAGELFCHAQSCIWLLGYSDLGDLLKAGKDPHSDFAATLRNVNYDEFIKRKKERSFKDGRQAAKAFVFAKPGGGSGATICLQARTSGPDTPCENGPVLIDDGSGHMVKGYKGTRFCILMNGAERCGVEKTTKWGYNDRIIKPTCVACLKISDFLSKRWEKQWKENPEYFEYMKGSLSEGYLITEAMTNRWTHWQSIFRPNTRMAPGEIVQHVSGRIRRTDRFTVACNTLFQGLLADITLSAYWRATRESYDKSVIVPSMAHENSKVSAYANGPSPLLGSTIPGFLHDELLAEHNLDVAHDAATRISEIMLDEMRWYLPDLADACEAEPALMSVWNKNAETKRNTNGKLIVWTP